MTYRDQTVPPSGSEKVRQILYKGLPRKNFHHRRPDKILFHRVYIAY